MKKILFIEGGLPSPQIDAGSLANLEFISLLRSLGHRVSYLFTGYHPNGSIQELHDLGCEVIDGVDLVAHEQQVSLLKAHAIELAILSRPGPALQWIESVRSCTIPSVYFGHDIHHVRLERAHALEPSAAMQSYRVHKVIEPHLWKLADVVVYPTHWECEYAMARSGRAHAIPMPIYDIEGMAPNRAGAVLQTPLAEKGRGPHPILFVGGAHHGPNPDGLRWFLAEVAPRLMLDVELSVVGAWDIKTQQRLLETARTSFRPTSRLIFTGSVTQDALWRHYDKAALVIAPLRYGAGLKRKVVEALMQRRPLLTTPMGLEGIELEPSQYEHVCSELDGGSFARRAQACLALPPAVHQHQSEAMALQVTRQFSRERRLDSLAQIFALC